MQSLRPGSAGMSAPSLQDPLRVACAGDLFIRAERFAAGARSAFGPSVRASLHESRWPDEPFGSVDGVREAAGDPGEIAELAADAEILLTHLAPITGEVFAAAPQLRVVGSVRGGPVNIDLAAATEHGVPVVYLPGRNLGAVAEFAIGAMISISRNITPASRDLINGRWDGKWFREELTGPELRAATVGLVGLGAIGLRVAQLLQAFGATVIAYDPFADAQDAGRAGVRLVELDELLASSDLVSVHARLTDDTRKMFDAEAFARMKPGAGFVNTARGELVDSRALLEALRSGRLRGAALDVFDPEPPDPTDELLAQPGLLPTPHLAGSSVQVATESVTRVCAEIAQFIDTGQLEHCANPGWSDADRE